MKNIFECGIVLSFIMRIQCSDCDLSKTNLTECQINCRILYQGKQNFFNISSGNCEVVAVCSTDSNFFYDYSTNLCSSYSNNNNNQVSSSKNVNNQSLSSMNLNNSLSEDLNQTLVTSPPIICVNGTTVNINNQSDCICNQGWGDSKNQSLNTSYVLKCDQTASNQYIDYSNQSYMNQLFYNLTQSNSDSQSNLSFFTNLPMIYQILIIGSIFIVLLCISCGALIFFKYKLKKKSLKTIQQKKEEPKKHHHRDHSRREIFYRHPV